MKYFNETNSTSESIDCYELYRSYSVFTQSRKINIFFTILIIIIGLVGNIMTVSVFMQKRFRINSSCVYLLCMAISDGLFLIIHFFEDTLRTFKDVYINKNSDDLRSFCSNSLQDSAELVSDKSAFFDLIQTLNITDRFDLTCRLFNYFRYLLRFISAYIIVAFTVQRASVIHSPLKDNFKSKKSAWIAITIISLIAILTNLWVPFLFQTQSHENNLYCDIQKKYSKEYFKLTIIYISVIMLIPILTIFIGNSVIIVSTIKANLRRKKMQNCAPTNEASSSQRRKTFKSSKSVNYSGEMRPLKRGATNKSLHSRNNSTKITRMMIFISLSYAILNLPYFITWCVFFYGMAFKKINSKSQNYLFAAIQVSEIFYILNYGIHFYIYFCSGKNFRKNIILMFKQLSAKD